MRSCNFLIKKRLPYAAAIVTFSRPKIINKPGAEYLVMALKWSQRILCTVITYAVLGSNGISMQSARARPRLVGAWKWSMHNKPYLDYIATL